ncbi:MAG: chitobiase/beta-hexosaminidase C-terminal domain-containing protein, partial [Planctomycetota bacterium]
APAIGDETGDPRVHEVAQPRRLPDGAPKASDVIMRSLRLRVGKDESQHDTFRALGDFHVNRLEWAYIRDENFIVKCRKKGVLFGGAASSALSHVVMPKGDSDYSALACVNLHGEPVVPTWKRAWQPPGNWWMCVNNPTLEKRYTEYLNAYLDAGAQVMQRDEPWGNYRAVHWGGCFCDHCMTAFRKFLTETTTDEERSSMGIEDSEQFNYREHLVGQGAPVGDAFKRFDGGRLKQRFEDFQRRSTIAFHQRTWAAVNEHAGRRVAFSCNNGCRRWTPIEMLFDWCFGELSFTHASPEFIHDAMLEATARDRRQVITMPKKSNRDDLQGWRRLTRRTIAMAYACGGHCMVPWDVYMPGDAPRYFGAPEQYADLFGFIRATSDYLDQYEYAGAFGDGLSCDSYGERPPLVLHDAEDVRAILRALPGKKDSPIVVHLIDWSDNPQPFELSLNPTAFFGDSPLRLTLLAPAPYDRARHARAEENRSYGGLVETTALEGGYQASFSLPAVTPWALLVIEPDDSITGGVWQPVIRANQSDFHREKLGVTLATPGSDANLHFTTDGTIPTAASPRYSTPIALSRTATIKAVAVMPDGRKSPLASASFIRLAERSKPLVPDSPALRESLKLWLSADFLGLADGASVQAWPARVGPSALAEPQRARSGIVTQPPSLALDAANGMPVVRFDGIADSIAVKGFADRHLAGTDFTIFMVSQSESSRFGMCGNGIWGSGGDPRLYLQRGAFRYHELGNVIALRPTNPGPTISVFMHDGQETILAATNGSLSEPLSGVPVVSKFGGGNLAIPFWSGNENRAGDMAEIAVYDRLLSPVERVGVETYLAEKYSIEYARRWERE